MMIVRNRPNCLAINGFQPIANPTFHGNCGPRTAKGARQGDFSRAYSAARKCAGGCLKVSNMLAANTVTADNSRMADQGRTCHADGQ